MLLWRGRAQLAVLDERVAHAVDVRLRVGHGLLVGDAAEGELARVREEGEAQAQVERRRGDVEALHLMKRGVRVRVRVKWSGDVAA